MDPNRQKYLNFIHGLNNPRVKAKTLRKRAREENKMKWQNKNYTHVRRRFVDYLSFVKDDIGLMADTLMNVRESLGRSLKRPNEDPPKVIESVPVETLPPSKPAESQKEPSPTPQDKSVDEKVEGFQSYFDKPAEGENQESTNESMDSLAQSKRSAPLDSFTSEEKDDDKDSGNPNDLYVNSLIANQSKFRSYSTSEDSSDEGDDDNDKSASPLVPMASKLFMFQEYFKVMLLNLHPQVDYDDVNNILMDVGFSSEEIEDIMVINQIHQSISIISFNNQEAMMKALSYNEKLTHKGRIINIKDNNTNSAARKNTQQCQEVKNKSKRKLEDNNNSDCPPHSKPKTSES